MKKIIAKTLYDTDMAHLVYKHTCGFVGESDGYEESLYKTDEGKYFLYVNGGADSPYPEENIKRISPARAEQWLAEKNK